jgi:hypothetical protein
VKVFAEKYSLTRVLIFALFRVHPGILLVMHLTHNNLECLFARIFIRRGFGSRVENEIQSHILKELGNRVNSRIVFVQYLNQFLHLLSRVIWGNQTCLCLLEGILVGIILGCVLDFPESVFFQNIHKNTL